MSRALIAIFCCVLCACQAAEDGASGSTNTEPVEVEVINSLRIHAHRVKIRLETDGKTTVEIQDLNEGARTSERTLEAGEMTFVQSLARQIEWKRVARDDVLGADGTSVRVHYCGEDYSVWTPSYDTDERRLGEFLKLKNELFRLAGLTEAGLLQ